MHKASLLKKLVIFAQMIALSLSSQTSRALPASFKKDPTAQRLQQLFLSTSPIQTKQGYIHVEVQAMEINSEQDIATAQAEFLEKTQKNPNTNELFILDVRTTEHQTSSLDTTLDATAQKALNKIEDTILFKHKIKNPPILVEPPNKNGFFKRHYNLTLALVRFVGNSTAITTGLIIGKGIPVEHALLVGLLAGAASGAIQIKSAAVFKWLSNSVLLVNTAKKMGLLAVSHNNQISQSERILREFEMYGRWATLETGFLLACQTAMSLLNIPIAENLFTTAAKSTLSQGVFDVGILKAADQLEKINPNWNSKIAVFKNVSLFVGSGISTLAAIGSMVGIPFSNLLFITLTTSGLILNFSPKLIKLKPLAQILQGWSPVKTASGVIIRCGSLFE